MRWCTPSLAHELHRMIIHHNFHISLVSAFTNRIRNLPALWQRHNRQWFFRQKTESAGTIVLESNILRHQRSTHSNVGKSVGHSIQGCHCQQSTLCPNQQSRKFSSAMMLNPNASFFLNIVIFDDFQWSSEYTWFLGYKWRVCLCPKCSRQLGWMFEPEDSESIDSLHSPTERGFYALITSDILTESCNFVFTILALSFSTQTIDRTFFWFISDVNSLLMTELENSEL